MDPSLTSGSKYFLEQINTLQKEVLIQSKGSEVKEREKREQIGLFYLNNNPRYNFGSCESNVEMQWWAESKCGKLNHAKISLANSSPDLHLLCLASCIYIQGLPVQGRIKEWILTLGLYSSLSKAVSLVWVTLCCAKHTQPLVIILSRVPAGEKRSVLTAGHHGSCNLLFLWTCVSFPDHRVTTMTFLS